MDLANPVDYWDPWNFDQRRPLTEYDSEGCLNLLAAIVRRWWLDGLYQRCLLKELADWMEVDVETFTEDRPAKFYVRR